LAKNLQYRSNETSYVLKEYIRFNKKDYIGEFIKDSFSSP